MSERYIITGVQLGMLKEGKENTRKKLVEEIVDKQFVGDKNQVNTEVNIEDKIGIEEELKRSIRHPSNFRELMEREILLEKTLAEIIDGLFYQKKTLLWLLSHKLFKDDPLFPVILGCLRCIGKEDCLKERKAICLPGEIKTWFATQ